MILKSMTATFGKLEQAQLRFDAGLNVIHAPNESGKSTWAAFYRAMLYGIDTKARDKKGFLAEKNRYQPWSGAAMEGEMIVQWQGRDLAIRRGARGSTPFGAFSAIYADTGEQVQGMTAENCGLLLTGVPREVFERSAFIGGEDLHLTSTPALEQRIAAIFSSGEEGVSFSQAEGRLREWRNRRKVNRSVGQIPQLEQQLEQSQHALRAQQDTAALIATLEEKTVTLQAQCDALKQKLAQHQLYEQGQLHARYLSAKQELDAAQQQLLDLQQEFGKYGEIPTRARAQHAQEQLQNLRLLEKEIRHLEQQQAAQQQECNCAQNLPNAALFPNMTGQQALDTATQASIAVQTAQKNAQRLKRLFPLFQICGLLIFALLGGYDLLGQGGITALFFGGLLAYFLCAMCSAMVLARSSRQKKQASTILQRYGAADGQEILDLAQGYFAALARYEQMQQALAQTSESLTALQGQYAAEKQQLLAFVHSFAPEVRDLFGCSAALSRSLSLEHELRSAQERVSQRRSFLQQLRTQGGEHAPAKEVEAAPACAREQLQADLQQTAAELAQCKQQLDRALGQQQAIGEGAQCYAAQDDLTQQLAARQQEYDALELALAVLDQANAQLHQRFSPQLNQCASAYFRRLTKQTYTGVTLQRSFEAVVAREGDILPHDALYLSKGTTDQLYLAVRLAVCKLCLEQKPPIFLDDALTAFDDQRLAAALELLQELAKEQQIVLFTCQNREGGLLPEK